MEEFEFLKSLVIIFGVSAIVVFLLDKLRIPSIIGFLIAGVFLGPHGLELIKDINLINVFAEIGVVLLLFIIGLEFSIKKLITLRRTIFIGGALQVLITFFLVFGITYSFLHNAGISIIFGFLISLSSTAIVMKLLFDRAEIDSLHGRISVGILIFQDLCVVLFMLLIPMISEETRDFTKIIWVLLESFGIIFLIIISAYWLVPKLLYHIVRTRKRELFIISIIFLCFGTAFLTYELGLSLAIGAFIAGLIISESEYSYQAISDILPFKDSFNGLFFISVGMLMDVQFFLSNIYIVLLVVFLILLIKTFSSTVAIFINRYNLRISIHSALVLAQIGEFSFVLSVAAMKVGLLNEQAYQVFLSSSIVTMILTPLLISFSPHISAFVTSRGLLKRIDTRKATEKMADTQSSKTDHVIIVGFGINGRNLALVLKELEVPYVILELNNETVLKMLKTGEPIYYGDSTSSEILHKMGIEQARVVVIAISDPAATRKTVKTARSLNPRLYILVRTRFVSEVKDLLSLGADDVVPEEFETSIELFSRALKFYQMPRILIERYSEKFRSDHYSMFIKQETPKRIFHDSIAVMPDIEYESCFVKKGSKAENKSIQELGIRSNTGALVIAVKRGDRMINGPAPDFVFNVNDIVFMIGDKTSLEKANVFFV